MSNILNKEVLLNLLDMVDSDCKIRLLVNTSHINVLDRDSYPYFYTPKDETSVKGIAYLSVGAGYSDSKSSLTLATSAYELNESPEILQNSSIHIPVDQLNCEYALSYAPLTKKSLLNIVSKNKNDELIRVLVDLSDVNFFNPEPAPHLLPKDIKSLKKQGSADLCIATLVNRDHDGVTLITRSS